MMVTNCRLALIAVLAILVLPLGVEANITITSPQSGATWPVGSRQVIRWTSGAHPAVAPKLSRDGGQTWAVVSPSEIRTSLYEQTWIVRLPDEWGVSDCDP